MRQHVDRGQQARSVLIGDDVFVCSKQLKYEGLKFTAGCFLVKCEMAFS